MQIEEETLVNSESTNQDPQGTCELKGQNEEHSHVLSENSIAEELQSHQEHQEHQEEPKDNQALNKEAFEIANSIVEDIIAAAVQGILQ